MNSTDANCNFHPIRIIMLQMYKLCKLLDLISNDISKNNILRTRQANYMPMSLLLIYWKIFEKINYNMSYLGPCLIMVLFG